MPPRRRQGIRGAAGRPTADPACFNRDEQKIGHDGRMWRVARNRSGQHRWVRVGEDSRRAQRDERIVNRGGRRMEQDDMVMFTAKNREHRNVISLMSKVQRHRDGTMTVRVYRPKGFLGFGVSAATARYMENGLPPENFFTKHVHTFHGVQVVQREGVRIHLTLRTGGRVIISDRLIGNYHGHLTHLFTPSRTRTPVAQREPGDIAGDEADPCHIWVLQKGRGNRRAGGNRRSQWVKERPEQRWKLDRCR